MKTTVPKPIRNSAHPTRRCGVVAQVQARSSRLAERTLLTEWLERRNICEQCGLKDHEECWLRTSLSCIAQANDVERDLHSWVVGYSSGSKKRGSRTLKRDKFGRFSARIAPLLDEFLALLLGSMPIDQRRQQHKRAFRTEDFGQREG